jgi:hypothetical protein
MLIRRIRGGPDGGHWFSVHKPELIRCTPSAKSFTLTQTMFGQTMNIRSWVQKAFSD